MLKHANVPSSESKYNQNAFISLDEVKQLRDKQWELFNKFKEEVEKQ